VVKKLDIFDFDGTLFFTPLPDPGKKTFQQKTGRPWPYEGWWGRVESLNFPLISIPNDAVIQKFRESYSNPDTRTVMMTGRWDDYRKKGEEGVVARVLELLSESGINVTRGKDAFFKWGGGTTLNWKLTMIKRFLDQDPDIESVEMWEDRPVHADAFESFASEIGIPVEVNRIDNPHENLRHAIRSMITESDESDPVRGAGIIILKEVDRGKYQALGMKLYGKYDLPKGKLEPGENPLQGALREAEEEAGISDLKFTWGHDSFETSYVLSGKAKSLDPEMTPGRRKIVTVFLAETKQNPRIRKNPETGIYEHHAAVWMPLRDLERKLYRYLRPSIKWARKKVEE